VTAVKAQRPLEEHWLSAGQDHNSEQMKPWYVATGASRSRGVGVGVEDAGSVASAVAEGRAVCGVWHTPAQQRGWSNRYRSVAKAGDVEEVGVGEK